MARKNVHRHLFWKGDQPMRATLNGRIIADSDDIVESGGYAYFPATATHLELLEKAAKTASDHACPHGVQFYDAVLDGQRYERAAWSYERPQPKMHPVGGRFGFWKDITVA
jgi:uncharacterized protein (DUF427 family)